MAEADWFDIPEPDVTWRAPRLRLLADAQVPAALVEEIRRGGGIDIRSAQEIGVATLADPELFRAAKRLGRVLLTMDARFGPNVSIRARRAAVSSSSTLDRRTQIGRWRLSSPHIRSSSSPTEMPFSTDSA